MNDKSNLLHEPYDIGDLVDISRTKYEREIGLSGVVISRIGIHHYEINFIEPWKGASGDIEGWQWFAIVSDESMDLIERANDDNY